MIGNLLHLFHAAHAPKYLLELHNAGHLAPYTTPGPALGVVERVTTAFLDHFLRDAPLQELQRVAGSASLATLTSG